MSMAERSTPSDAREQAIAETVARVRRLEADMGVSREMLRQVRAELIALAGDGGLWPAADYPLKPDGGNQIYRLSEDPDHRFALYMSVARPGMETPPHDHTTWAVIVGLKGQEHNRFYRRTDDGQTPGHGTVEAVEQHTVERGTGVCLMPEDIHSIHLEGEPPTLMFHMYGLAIDHLPGRVAYDTTAGTYKTFGVTTGIQEPVYKQP